MNFHRASLVSTNVAIMTEISSRILEYPGTAG
jgi:hypothetical protein